MTATHLKLVGVALCFAGTFAAGRVAAAELEPFTAAFLRFAVGSSLLVLWLWRTGERPTRDPVAWGWLVVLALSGIVAYNVCFFLGLQRIEASRASLIIALNPVGIALGGHLFFHERMGLRRAVGLLLAVAGAVTVIVRGRWEQLSLDAVGPGEAWILGCVASWVTFTLVGRVASRRLSPGWVATGSSVLGTAMLLPLAHSEGLEVRAGPGAWGGILFLGIFGTALAFVWYQQGIQRLGPTRAGAFICLVPVFGSLIAAALLGEPLTPSVAVGATLVGVGLSIAQGVDPRRLLRRRAFTPGE